MIDGTGINPSVTEEIAEKLLNYILSKEGKKSIIDLGTGVGNLVKVGKSKDIDILGVEGSSIPKVVQVIECNFFDLDIPKRDISTSFEVIEHIEECNQDRFWNLVKKISNVHYCSIHVGRPYPGDGHVFIRDRFWWENYFTYKGISFKYLDDFPINTWALSLFYRLEF